MSRSPLHPAYNPFNDPQVAARYEAWYSGPGRRAEQQEKVLFHDLLKGFPDVVSILEVGCGTGHFTRWFRELGYIVTGLDSSPAMIREANRLTGLHSVVGDAQDLPFADRSFDIVALITTLEFVRDPATAIREAGRVARQGLLLGVLNRLNLRNWRRHRSQVSPWNACHFYTPGELSQLVVEGLGGRCVAIRWLTSDWPWTSTCLGRLPWGGIIGMAVSWNEPSPVRPTEKCR